MTEEEKKRELAQLLADILNEQRQIRRQTVGGNFPPRLRELSRLLNTLYEEGRILYLQAEEMLEYHPNGYYRLRERF